MSMFVKDNLQNRQYNDWLVIGEPTKHNNKIYYLSRCKCGVEKLVETNNLKSGRSKSCRKCSAKIVAATTHITHNKSKTKVYRAWQSMKTRCYNANATSSYKYHGALGVRVCAEWLNDFEAFYAHIGEPPSKYHTIDRRDVFKDYEPGNVRWATQYEQMHNLRKHHEGYYQSNLKKLFDPVPRFPHPTK